MRAFWMYDDDEGGTIDIDNLKNAALELEFNVTTRDLHDMVKFADKNNKGEVSLNDFMDVMRDAGLYDEAKELEK